MLSHAAGAEHDDHRSRRARAPPRIRLASYTQNNAGTANAPTSNGPVIGQPIVLDTGANQEVVTVKRHIAPIPAAPAPNVVLSAPLKKDHAAGHGDHARQP